MKTIIGIMDSQLGGVNNFIANYIKNNPQIEFVVLCNERINDFYLQNLSNIVDVLQLPSVLHPLRLYKMLDSYLKANSIDSFYFNGSTMLHYPLLLAASKNNVKSIIFHSHSSYSAEENFIKRSVIILLHKIFRKLQSRLDITRKACSDKAASWMFEKNADYKFIHNKVDYEKFKYNPAVRLQLQEEFQTKGKLVIGFIGSFCYQKKNKYFIKLAEKLKKKNVDFKIVMVGSGIQFDSFCCSVKKNHLEEYFILTGNRTDANKFYNLFDVFVLPSRFEGLPFVGIEAQMNGLKCFFSKAITRQVKITDGCEYFDLKNTKELADEISKIPLDRNYRISNLKNFNDFLL